MTGQPLTFSKNSAPLDENKTTAPSDQEDAPQLKVPIPLVEENKEPGVSAVLHFSLIFCLKYR